MSHRVTIEPHRESWRTDFAHEARRLESALGPALKILHHIGSTAVPGLWAKPIIDILAEVISVEAIDGCGPEMERLGYEVMGEFGIAGRRYFRKNDASGARSHHVHAFAAGSPSVTRHLAFRDYLRTHPAVAAEYSALKLRLLEACNGDLQTYVDGKDAFVKDVERKALEALSRMPQPGVRE